MRDDQLIGCCSVKLTPQQHMMTVYDSLNETSSFEFVGYEIDAVKDLMLVKARMLGQNAVGFTKLHAYLGTY